jgi:hypothetical protein
LEILKYPIRKKLLALVTKGNPRARTLLETLDQLVDDPASMKQRIDEVTESLLSAEKERLTSFIESKKQELKLHERCRDLEEKGFADAQALFQELNKIQGNTTWETTEEEDLTII